MRLTSITITDLAAFHEFTATLPAIAYIQGKNGLGKSSLVNVIKYAFGRRPSSNGSRGVEHDPSMLHGNAERGEAVLTFDDESQLRVLVTLTDTTRMVKAPGVKKWTRGTKDIDDLANAISYDPIQFKTFSEKQRVETILRIMPVTVTAEEIKEAIGDVAIPPPTEPSLEAINSIYQSIYDLRRSENTAADTQEKHAGQLEEALPPASADGDYASELVRLRKEKEDLEAQENAAIATIGKLFREEERNQGSADVERREAVDKAINDKIAALEVERRTHYQNSNDERVALVESARSQANGKAKEVKATNAPLRDKLVSDIAAAETHAKAASMAEGTRAAAIKARSEAMGHRLMSNAMTDALARLTTLKESVASRLPIQGITIASPKPGQPVDICREEEGALIPFSSWNDTSQTVFCLKLAVQTTGKCGLVCVDSIDAMDPEAKQALRATCERYVKRGGLQFILGVATGGPLRVTEDTDGV